MNDLLTNLGTLCAVVGAISGWTFVLRYRRDNWRRYETGRHLMRFTFGLTVILSYVVVRSALAFVGQPPWLVVVDRVARLLIFAWVAYQLTFRARMLLRFQSDPVHPDRTHEEHRA
jgi:hypothetical protein